MMSESRCIDLLLKARNSKYLRIEELFETTCDSFRRFGEICIFFINDSNSQNKQIMYIVFH